MTPQSPDDLGFPGNWDRLKDRRAPEADDGRHDSQSAEPPILAVLAAAWGDLVAILAVCAAALVALVGFGHRATLPCLPWAFALALVWWCAAAAILLTVRRATPGMLMAGGVLEDNVAPRRLLAVLAMALILLATLGVPALLGSRRSPLGRVAGSRLKASGEAA